MVMLIMLYKVVLTFESVDGILKCGHSNDRYLEQFLAVLLKGIFSFIFWTTCLLDIRKPKLIYI